MVDDIASTGSAPPLAPVPRKLGAYRNFVTERRAVIYTNAKAYTNKRIEARRFADTKLRKVLNGATYIQADPHRYASGQFNVEFMKYFVIHRPGKYPPACTLLNTLRTFSDYADLHAASTHFVIGLNGELIQMVDLADQAYHCGTSKKAGAVVLNANSVGVELEGAIHERFTLRQYQTLATVIRKLHDLSGFLGDLNRPTFVNDTRPLIVGHQEINSDKKDPGYNFNYYLLATMIRAIPATDKNSMFRPPVDPFFEIETALQAVVSEAQNPESVGSGSLIGGATQDALAMQRAILMSMGGRTDMAYAAATAAQRQAAFMARKVAEMQKKIDAMGLTWEAVPNPEVDFGTYLDYSGSHTAGIGTYVTKEKKKEKKKES